MRDHRWRPHPVSHRGKRGEALIEATTRLSLLFWPVFHLVARHFVPPLRLPTETAIKPGLAPFQLLSSLARGPRLTACRPDRNSSILTSNQVFSQSISRLVASCVPVAPARGRSVASSQTCPNEYLILT